MLNFRLIQTSTFIAMLMVLSHMAADDLLIDVNSELVQDVNGDLIVRSGAAIVARDIRVSGNVLLESGASFYGHGIHVDGNLIASNAGDVFLAKSALRSPQIGGDVEIAFTGGAIRLFDTHVSGHLLIGDNSAFEIVLKSNVVDRDVQVFANQVESDFLLQNNLVSGNIQTALNQPVPQDLGNNFSGPPALGSLIEVTVAGSEGDELCEIQIDQKAVRQWTATTSFRKYRFRSADILTADRIRIEFNQDAGSSNAPLQALQVDSIAIDGEVYETEEPSVYSSGTLIAGQVVGPGFHRTETLNFSGYFQYGLTGTEDDLMLFALNDVLPDGWTFALSMSGSDIGLQTYDSSRRAAFYARFGSAGVISSIQDVRSRKELLAPTYRGESTDRVLQWTIWEQGKAVVYDVPSLPAWEDRFNLTQAGTFRNVLHGTVEVVLSPQRGQLDVWSVADRLWKSELEAFIQGSSNTLTRTNVLDCGAILVRRVVRIGEIKMNGKEVSLSNPYFEAWSPFSDRTFNSMALGFDDRGRPTQWYADSKNIPMYPAWPVAGTRGWAMAYNRYGITRKPAIAVVYGRDQGRIQKSDGVFTPTPRFVLNSMDFSGGFAILPGLWTGALPNGSIIDQYFVFMPKYGIDGNTGKTLDDLANRIPAPRVYHPGAPLRGELSVIADRLSMLSEEPRTSTDHLGQVK